MTELKIIRVESFILSNFTLKHFKKTNPIKIDTNEFRILKISSEKNYLKRDKYPEYRGITSVHAFLKASKILESL